MRRYVFLWTIENDGSDSMNVKECEDGDWVKFKDAEFEVAALREENDIQRYSIQQLSKQWNGINTENEKLWVRSIEAETRNSELSAQVVGLSNVLKNINACCKPFVRISGLAEDIAKACYDALSSPDPGADIRERMAKLEAVAAASKEICKECREEGKSEGWHILCEEQGGRECEFRFIKDALAALGDRP
jgi:hypothetical protein